MRSMHRLIRPQLRVYGVRYASSALKKTPLYALHQELEGKMVDFAGYAMPIQYKDGIVKSHHHTRSKGCASMFDVSHMGQIRITGKDREAFLESLTVVDLAGLADGEGKLSLITNEQGGIIDDCVISKYEDHIYMVVNAANKDFDLQQMHERLASFKGEAQFQLLDERALVALQGPGAAEIVQELGLFPSVCFEKLNFMNGTRAVVSKQGDLQGVDAILTRCGYTGEDGFEISVPSTYAERFVRQLLKSDQVLAAGLGARDSLRLEAGLCLHGNDITASTTPIEGSLAWTIAPRRREEGGFPGHAVIMDQLRNKTYEKKRIGFVVDGAAARHGAILYDTENKVVGSVTSGTFSPTLKKAIGMAYVQKGVAKLGTDLLVKARNKDQSVKIAKMPFVPANYYRIK